MATPFDPRKFRYAHRGLWSANGPPENSLEAFRQARAKGLGIEFDVRPARDGTPIVFHDDTLDRMTPKDGPIEQLSAKEAVRLPLAGTRETIPTFLDLLRIWPYQLPLLTELKIDGQTDPEAFARRVGDRLCRWKGFAAAMSFSEKAVRALPRTLMRGQLIRSVSHTSEAEFDEVADRAIADGIDYLSVHHTDVERASLKAKAAGKPVVVWTVRTEDDLDRVARHKPAVIFEHLAPDLVAKRLST
ncbi:MAG: glycerophosphodiester phosphodiesterase family protein [Hyphomonas sp.]|uniref:glycerophosphodiester phosphodiesterase family protein n=1 Tax=Hyphomonas sp. TaxID=87 RepID=UPI00352875A7